MLTTVDVKNALKDLDFNGSKVDVSNLVYNGTKTTYITFQIYDEYGAVFAEDTEISADYLVQVNIFSKSDYTSLVNAAYQAMLKANFERTHATETFEDDTKYYHKILRFKKRVDN